MEASQPAAAFERHFGRRATVVAAAPGRVNLIGEHVDYIGGLVLPFAIAQRTWTAAAADDSGRISVRSDALGSDAEFAVDVAEPVQPSTWENYVRGMVFGLRERGVRLPGARLWIGGDLPPGSGMSSSAALCISTGLALAGLANEEIPLRDMALIARQSEHKFAGTPCGLMDQLASCFGRERHALLIDCRDLTHAYVPFEPEGITILAIPSGVKHDLADGAYEQRVKSCHKAVAVISETNPDVTSLRDVTVPMLEACKSRLDPLTYKRARHVATELARVTAAAAALRAGDLKQLGSLLWQTQDSLRDDYEVSCEEIDQIISLLRHQDGVLGARMVGGGFGGVALAIVTDAAADNVIRRLETDYYAPNKRPDRPNRVRPSAGASVMNIGNSNDK